MKMALGSSIFYSLSEINLIHNNTVKVQTEFYTHLD